MEFYIVGYHLMRVYKIYQISALIILINVKLLIFYNNLIGFQIKKNIITTYFRVILVWKHEFMRHFIIWYIKVFKLYQ